MKPTDGDLAGVHVLLVDDTEDVLEMFGSYLRYVGAVVTLARNGSEALACLAQARAHVIVTDLAMPGMDGVEFVARLRGDRGQGEHCCDGKQRDWNDLHFFSLSVGNG